MSAGFVVVAFFPYFNSHPGEGRYRLFAGDSNKLQLNAKLAIHIVNLLVCISFPLCGVVVCSLLLRMDASHFWLILKNFFLLMQKKPLPGISPEGVAYQAARGK